MVDSLILRGFKACIEISKAPTHCEYGVAKLHTGRTLELAAFELEPAPAECQSLKCVLKSPTVYLFY